MEGFITSALDNIIVRSKTRIMAFQRIVDKTWSSVSFPKVNIMKNKKNCSKEVAAVQSEYLFLHALNCD